MPLLCFSKGFGIFVLQKLLELDDVVSSALALYDTLTKAYLMKADFYLLPARYLLSVVTTIVTSKSRGKLYQPTEMSLKVKPFP